MAVKEENIIIQPDKFEEGRGQLWKREVRLDHTEDWNFKNVYKLHCTYIIIQ